MRGLAPASAGATSPPDPALPTPPSTKRKGFLSFSLPSETLEADRSLRFEIVPSLSRAGFDAKSTLHDFTGTTSDVSGSFVARLTQPGTGSTGRVRVEVGNLDTGIVERNAEMAQALESKKFPAFEFELTSFEATSADSKALTSSGTAHGKMTIHGVTREIAFPLRVSVDESRRVVIEGEAPIRLTEYGITPPKKFGLIAVEDQIKLWVAIRARPAGRAE